MPWASDPRQREACGGAHGSPRICLENELPLFLDEPPQLFHAVGDDDLKARRLGETVLGKRGRQLRAQRRDAILIISQLVA